MSKGKHRAIISRAMRGIANGTRPALHAARPQVKRTDAYRDTIAHLRERSRFCWRIRVATGDERKNRLAVEFIELYETYLLRKRYRNTLDIHEWRRKHLRKRPELCTPLVLEAVMLWYALHGKERIQRLRKQHAIFPNGLLITSWYN